MTEDKTPTAREMLDAVIKELEHLKRGFQFKSFTYESSKKSLDLHIEFDDKVPIKFVHEDEIKKMDEDLR